MRTIFLSMLLITSQLFSYGSQGGDQMVVQLATEKKLMPIYLSTFYLDNPGVDNEYVKTLRYLMTFDLGYNGVTQMVKNRSDLDEYLDKLPYNEFGDLRKWKQEGIQYIVKVRVQNRELDVRVMSTNGGMVRGVDNLPLTGELNHDRKQVHRLADAAHRLLFGEEGIASTRILFTRRVPVAKGKWDSEVWEMDYDGGNPNQITRNSGYSVTPVYATPKPGQRASTFYYVSYLTGQPKIYVASLRDGVGRRFSTLRGNQLLPAVSRKQDKVAFVNDFTGNPDLFLQPIDPSTKQVGKPFQIFAHHRATQGSPTFSPDGNQVAFVSNKDGNPKVYVMPIPKPGTRMSQVKPTLLTRYQRSSTSPSWSPDGSKIAFSALTHGVRQIWIYDFNKKEEVQLTTGPDHKENPSWAPNSLHLTYNTVSNNGSDIYILNLNQPKPVKILSGNGEHRFPNWEPRATAS